ncbi:hypothetical protein CYMTET_27646 [Cymbomonas tetramitiformis]|uniref:Uncharacterized protein n=1 Tax=Cymbomonas tetramitiformis TaxID=36881 RepID=A0AAE0FPZ4_9CHLO|nr:hypothetical protein CYMTET_27646 [Cymbomonas tetramitiformis]
MDECIPETYLYGTCSQDEEIFVYKLVMVDSDVIFFATNSKGHAFRTQFNIEDMRHALAGLRTTRQQLVQWLMKAVQQNLCIAHDALTGDAVARCQITHGHLNIKFRIPPTKGLVKLDDEARPPEEAGLLHQLLADYNKRTEELAQARRQIDMLHARYGGQNKDNTPPCSADFTKEEDVDASPSVALGGQRLLDDKSPRKDPLQSAMHGDENPPTTVSSSSLKETTTFNNTLAPEITSTNEVQGATEVSKGPTLPAKRDAGVALVRRKGKTKRGTRIGAE